jgi:GTPase SAR1 family protein
MRHAPGEKDMSPIESGIWDLEELEDKVSKPNQWGVVGPKTFKAMTTTRKHITAGAYAITVDNNDGQPLFIQKDLKSDNLIHFSGSITDQILSEIDGFWGKADVFKKMGFLHRRGYLLYGPQGTGKSSIVQRIVTDVIGRGGVVFFCENTKFFSKGLTTFRQVEPDRPLVCVFEDIDAIIKRWGEDELLSILDGGNQVDKVLNLATTNYPELLDKRIISRPRRFDRVHKIGVPDQKIRTEYLRLKLPKTESIPTWVKETDGLSFAGMTEAIISVTCLGNKLHPTIKILRDIEKGHPSSDDFGAKVGVGFEEKEVEDDDLTPDIFRGARK